MAKNKLQHIVPRAYLKSWYHNTNSLWVYDKQNKIYSELNISNSFFGQNYTYNLTLNELDLLNSDEMDYLLEKFLIYNFIDKNGNNLKAMDVILNPKLFETISIYDKNGKKLSNQQVLRLKNTSFERIDKQFQQIENSWLDTLNKFTSICDITKRYNVVEKKDYDDVVFFAKSLYTRNPEIVNYHINHTKRNHPELNITADMYRKLFLSIQIELFENNEEKSLLPIKNCSPCFIVAAQDCKFVCPYNCAQYNFTRFEVKNGDKILQLDCLAWLPLSPKLLLLFIKNGEALGEDNVLYYDDINVSQLNEDLIKLSERYFISQNEIFTDEYIKSRTLK